MLYGNNAAAAWQQYEIREKVVRTQNAGAKRPKYFFYVSKKPFGYKNGQ